MILIRVDARLESAAMMVARAVHEDLEAIKPAVVRGTVYLGAGSANLIWPSDPRPHVMVPLTRGRRIDSIARAQLASSDAVVAMDETELVTLASVLSTRSALIQVSTLADDAALRVIRTSNPFDAAEVQEFRRTCPLMASILDRHAVPREDFSPRPVTISVLEALEAVGRPWSNDRPRPPGIDSA